MKLNHFCSFIIGKQVMKIFEKKKENNGKIF